MTRLMQWTFAVLVMVGLSACGFHLRGLSGPARPLPFTALFVSLENVTLGDALLTTLRRDERVQLWPQAKGAEAVLRVYGEASARDILTINRGGKVNEYQLTYRVSAELLKNGERYGAPMTIVVRREMGYSDKEILGKEQEEAMLWNDMRRDAAEQIVTRLSLLTPDMPQPVGTAHATSQP